MTSSAARCLVHLTHLSISDCYQIEDIIMKHEGEDDDEDKEIIFSKLKSLELEGLPRLNRFCGHNYTFKFPVLDQLTITRCPEFKTFSPGTTDTPSLRSVQLSDGWGEHREIWDTDLTKTFYQQIFLASREVMLDEYDAIMIRNIDQFPADLYPQVEFLRIQRIVDEGLTIPYALLERFPQLKALHVEHCSFGEIFPSHVPPSSTSFHNLTELKVSKCHHLVYLVTNSIAKNLVNLETFQIDDCKNMEEIVRKEPSEDVEGGITFNGLRILKLADLPRLKTKDEDKRDLNIEDRATNSGCKSLFGHKTVLLPKLEILELSNSVNNLILLIWDEQILHNSFSNLKTLILERCDFIKVVPLHVLKSLNNLEKMLVNRCNKLEMVFGFDDLNHYKEKASLLVAMPLNLTHLQVGWCYELTTLMTSLAARCLVHLTHLSISYCDQIEKIIMKHEGEDDDEDKEIIFNKLEFLKLDDLPRLKRFCGHNYTFKFPVLDQLTITRCPEFKTFSPGTTDTPSLRSVQLSDGWGEHREIWDTDLNKTFYQQRFVASRELVLDEYDAIMIRNIDQFPADPCSQVEILRIKRIVDEGLTFPCALLERFPQLKAIQVKHCSFGEIFPSFVPLSSISFHNLTKLKVSKCHHLLYFVTNSTAKCLVNLETLEINDCKTMEEIVRKERNEDVEGGITFNGLRILKLADLPRLETKDEDKRDLNIEDMATNSGCRLIFGHNTVLLPKLEILELSNSVNNLISLIWDEQILHNSFSNLKTLIVNSCDFIKVVPLYLLKSLSNLEELQVNDCNKLEMVFGLDDLNDYKEKMPSLVAMPLNLTHLEVEGCNGLTTLMTSSVSRSLVHLTYLSISYCNQIEEIITNQEGEDDETMEILFSKLEILELDDLPRLKRFCGHNYTFKFPLLKSIIIARCFRLTIFCPGAIYAPLLESVEVRVYETHTNIWKNNLNTTMQHRFAFEEVISATRVMALNAENITMIMEVFPEVESLYIESFQDEGVNFPYSSLERFPKLYRLYVEHCSFEEIFPSHDQIVDFMGKVPPFKELHIAHLDQLKCIWNDDSQLSPIHQNLVYLIVKSCCNLVKLAPASVSFQNLTGLKVSGCNQLIHLVTTSIAKGLVSLRRLEINDCKKMEEIVMHETNEHVQGAITFNQLREIQLTDMPSLKMFSSQSHNFKFPELREIKITGCPEMKMFYQGVLKTPELSKVKIEDHDMEWKDEGDLNKTIETPSSAKDSINI